MNISGVHRAGGMQTIVHTPHGIHTMEAGGQMSALHQPNQPPPPPPPTAASLTAVQQPATPPTLQVRPAAAIAAAQSTITYAKGITPAAKLQDQPTLAPAGKKGINIMFLHCHQEI